MKNLIKLEELSMLIAAFAIFLYLDYTWWWFFAFILLPDLSMVGYLINTQIGAFTYNLVHHRSAGILLGLLGVFVGNDPLIITGIILFAHCALDRSLGYGLKYPDDFKHTHLGWIGKVKKPKG